MISYNLKFGTHSLVFNLLRSRVQLALSKGYLTVKQAKQVWKNVLALG